jgi:AraC-like DNA-binding protein
MYQQQVIAQLLAWIEANLDQPLTLDDIAAKSGYSKWHLQRLFKQLTGHILGTYARRRRLTAAARELRLTHTGVACIADKYQFDSQQTFTRCFKKTVRFAAGRLSPQRGLVQPRHAAAAADGRRPIASGEYCHSAGHAAGGAYPAPQLHSGANATFEK